MKNTQLKILSYKYSYLSKHSIYSFSDCRLKILLHFSCFLKSALTLLKTKQLSKNTIFFFLETRVLLYVLFFEKCSTNVEQGPIIIVICVQLITRIFCYRLFFLFKLKSQVTKPSLKIWNKICYLLLKVTPQEYTSLILILHF